MSVITTAPRTLTTTQLSDLVRDLARLPHTWTPLIDASQPTRQWARIPVAAAADVWVISWPTEQATEFHSHGSASAAFTVVRGEVTEYRPAPDGTISASYFGRGRTQTVDEGVVHDVVNTRADTAVTIHAYSPRLDQMEFYSVSAGGLLLDRIEQAQDRPEW